MTPSKFAMFKRLHLFVTFTVTPLACFIWSLLTNDWVTALSFAGACTLVVFVAPFLVCAIGLFSVYLIYLAVQLILLVCITVYNMFAWYLDKKRISYEKWLE